MEWKRKVSGEWKAKFAFLPVKIKKTWIWLEWYDSTGWYYDSYKCVDDLRKQTRYPSLIKEN